LIQVRSHDVLWQKERLLNLALAALPPECEAVAWLDCDVILAREDWAVEARRLLENCPLVQPFHQVRDLAPTAAETSILSHSLAYQLGSGLSRQAVFRSRPQADGRLISRSGLACVFRRELFARHGLYASSVLGGNDRAMMCAAFGEFDTSIENWQMNARQAEYFLNWARPFHEEVRGRVGFLNGSLFHLWHGNILDRQYRQRHVGFKSFGFDPFTDIALDPNGCWRWNSDKPAMHEYVRSYFQSRNEDGRLIEQSHWRRQVA